MCNSRISSAIILVATLPESFEIELERLRQRVIGGSLALSLICRFDHNYVVLGENCKDRESSLISRIVSGVLWPVDMQHQSVSGDTIPIMKTVAFLNVEQKLHGTVHIELASPNMIQITFPTIICSKARTQFLLIPIYAIIKVDWPDAGQSHAVKKQC